MQLPRWIWTYFATLLLAPCLFAQQASVQGPVVPESAFASSVRGAADYALGAGDLIQVRVLGADKLSDDYRVDEQGRITPALLPPLEVSGKTAIQAADLLADAYQGAGILVHPSINIFVLSYGAQPVTVLGAVTHPGVYQLRGQRRLSEVIGMAGGLADNAGQWITLTPPAEDAGSTPPPPPQRVSVADLEMADTGTEALLVHPFEVITVQPAGNVFVVGDVVKPGGFPLRGVSSITVLQAVALAQGLSPTASHGDATIIRTINGTKQEIPVPLGKILQGKAPDTSLLADDILYIHMSTGKAAGRRGLDAAIAAATGVIIYH